jgi:hypothetical protein
MLLLCLQLAPVAVGGAVAAVLWFVFKFELWDAKAKEL